MKSQMGLVPYSQNGISLQSFTDTISLVQLSRPKLRGQNVNQFGLSPPLEWTNMNILSLSMYLDIFIIFENIPEATSFLESRVSFNVSFCNPLGYCAVSVAACGWV